MEPQDPSRVDINHELPGVSWVADNEASSPNTNSHLDGNTTAESKHNANPTTVAIELNIIIQFNRMLVALHMRDLASAASHMHDAFDLADRLGNEVWWARCKFWEGWMFAMMGREMNACAAFLSSITLVGVRPFETEKITKYLVRRWRTAVKYIREQYGDDADAACTLVDDLGALLKIPRARTPQPVDDKPLHVLESVQNSPVIHRFSRDLSALTVASAYRNSVLSTDITRDWDSKPEMPVLLADRLGEQSTTKTTRKGSIASSASDETRRSESPLFRTLRQELKHSSTNIDHIATLPNPLDTTYVQLEATTRPESPMDNAVDDLMKRLTEAPTRPRRWTQMPAAEKDSGIGAANRELQEVKREG